MQTNTATPDTKLETKPVDTAWDPARLLHSKLESVFLPPTVDVSGKKEDNSGESSGAVPNSLGTSKKLALLQEKFIGFEKQLELEAKIKRESEEVKIQTISENVMRLEKLLNAEVRRRIESNRSLSTAFESQVSDVQTKIETEFSSRIEKLVDGIGKVNERLVAIERDFDSERRRYVKDIEDKNALVARDVNTLQVAYDKDKALRSEKDTMILRKITELESGVEDRVVKEVNSAKERMDSLKDSITDMKQLKAKNDDKFQQFALTEITTLKSAINQEAHQREQNDNDIVQALNHYTRALQDALRIINQI